MCQSIFSQCHLLVGAFQLKLSDAILQTRNLSQMLSGVMLNMNSFLFSHLANDHQVALDVGGSAQ